ncbi:hypothetical protein [Mucilaginibacter sp. 22184]|uniref:hypothetical protein n=1 Tax=Mucilaginibacter sp. 22184 TaxID=3453887 RepID=UPI003F865D87
MKLSLNWVLNDVNEIKPLTLYYDKINIVDDATYSPSFDNPAISFENTFLPSKKSARYKTFLVRVYLDIPAEHRIGP